MNELKLLVSETEAFEDRAGPTELVVYPGLKGEFLVHFKGGEI